uniref:Translation factor GUF1 homolog, mitochondrial n=1 Tax=Caenorhabditis tropicalis TaxID=1561998 RepID=A0A1I7TBC8_9PELO
MNRRKLLKLSFYTRLRELAKCYSSAGDPTKLVSISEFTPDKIRNFGIVAHVDHGKSTLADRLLELCGAVPPGQKQMLDKLQVERERGITVKAQTAALRHNGFLLNLIDTPGHVDFSAEVSRSLAVCDGILLLVAANQGVQAQTIANFWLAFEKNIQIVPVINKIDLPGADIKSVETQLKTLFEFNSEECIHISAKSGLNVEKILNAIIERVPPPTAIADAPFRSMIFDSYFDHFRGAIAHIIVKEGSIKKGDKIRSYQNDKTYEVSEVGVMRPEMVKCTELNAGQVGYLVCNMRTVKEAVVGETLFSAESDRESIKTFSEIKGVKPTVYAGLFPVETTDYESLKQAVERLCLNDPSVTVTPDSSKALGLGWRIGFLGVLHMEVFGARLSQEYDASVILCQPSVEYRAKIKDNESIRKKRYDGMGEIRILDPSKFPDESDVDSFLEPMVKVRMIVPNEMMGTVNGLCSECRGERATKKLTSGYASFDYEPDGWQETRLVKLSILINSKEVSEFSQILPAAMARDRAKTLVQRLKREIPRQQFEVTIKACIGSSTKALSQIVIQPMKRDFSQLLKGNFGGGGMERLNKKLSHQKKGKERMKMLGNVQIPKEAFLNVLKN